MGHSLWVYISNTVINRIKTPGRSVNKKAGSKIETIFPFTKIKRKDVSQLTEWSFFVGFRIRHETNNREF